MNEPLVTIIIITYNSAKYVVETLESAKEQSYKNIELIVSDDCSTDNTVSICSEWINKNKSSFVSTNLITVKKNTGIPKNCNRGLYAAKGIWVKLIAGDDALMDNCIIDNIEFVNTDDRIKFCYSNFESYNNIFEESYKEAPNKLAHTRASIFSKLSCKFQTEVLSRKNILHGATTFYHKETLKSIGGYDETFRFMEDWPTWYKITKHRIKLHYLAKKTIKYRLHSDSVTGKEYQQEFLLLSIKNSEVTNTLFYHHYSKIEKFLYGLENNYINFYKKIEIKTIFGKMIKKLCYYSTSKLAEYKKDRALYYFYRKQLKEEKN